MANGKITIRKFKMKYFVVNSMPVGDWATAEPPWLQRRTTLERDAEA